MYPDAQVFNSDHWLNPGFPTFQEALTTYPHTKQYAALWGFLADARAQV